MNISRHWLWALAWLFAIGLAGCGGGGGDSGGAAAVTNRIYLLAAPEGRLLPATAAADGSVRWTLELQRVEPQAFWYTDRPARSTGASSVKDYVASAWAKAYGQVPPNATVHFQLAGQSGMDGVYASLSNPTFDEASNTLRFTAVVLARSATPVGSAALRFTQATVNILNNVDDSKEVASYVQYAGKGALQPSTSGGAHRLVLGSLDTQMLWVDNAPGIYHDVRPTSDFFVQWKQLFAKNPPNATLIGTTAAGGLRAYFVTLRDPAYDGATGTVSYGFTLVGGTDAPAAETLTRIVLNIDSEDLSRFPAQGKGTAYGAFGLNYDPSHANDTQIYFGSDAARKQMGSLWGTKSYLGESCEPHCRNDLQVARDMGVNLIRVYDWDPASDHSQFLDYAHSLGIKVVVSISNYLPTAKHAWDHDLPLYFNARNFGKASSTGKLDWHPAIAGVVISNELQGQSYDDALALTARFLQMARDKGFSSSVRVGVPVSFGLVNGQPEAWYQLQRFAENAALQPFKNQLMLAPQTYNDHASLFGNGQGSDGWVQRTYARFGLPILFSEIGANRVEHRDQTFVKEQLQGVLEYQRNHPEQLFGAIHFQFANKGWKQTSAPETDTEGAFGTFRHGKLLKTINTRPEDFDYRQVGTTGSLTIHELERTSTYEAVRAAYQAP